MLLLHARKPQRGFVRHYLAPGLLLMVATKSLNAAFLEHQTDSTANPENTPKPNHDPLRPTRIETENIPGLPSKKDHSNMKLRLLVPCLALALLTIGAHAQAGLYLNPSFVRISNSKADTGPFAFLGDNTTSRMFYGVMIGGYYDFYHAAKLDVGVDIRDNIIHGNNASLNDFSIALRVSPKPTLFVFKPYGELAVGAASSKPPTSSVHRSKASIEGRVGIDYPVAKHLDLHVIEVGYGTADTINSGNFGSGISFPNSKLLSFSSGLVFRIF